MDERTLVILDPVLKRGFTATPNLVLAAPELSLSAKALYSILLMFAWQQGECFPGQQKLAETAGCTDRTIRKYLDELREYGLISWTQRGLNQTNIYYINDISKVSRLQVLCRKDRNILSGPDRKGCSGQGRKGLSDKEDSDQNNPNCYISSEKKTLKTRTGNDSVDYLDTLEDTDHLGTLVDIGPLGTLEDIGGEEGNTDSAGCRESGKESSKTIRERLDALGGMYDREIKRYLDALWPAGCRESGNNSPPVLKAEADAAGVLRGSVKAGCVPEIPEGMLRKPAPG